MQPKTDLPVPLGRRLTVIGISALFLLSIVNIADAQSTEKSDYGLPASFPEIHGFFHFDAHFEQGEPAKYEAEHGVLSVTSKLGTQGKLSMEVFTEEEEQSIGWLQAFGSWKFNPALNVNFGLFMLPFGTQDHNYYCPLRLLNYRAWALEKTIPAGWHEMGFKIDGSFPLNEYNKFTYDIALTNGLVTNTWTGHLHAEAEDNNSNKRLTTRLNYYFGTDWNAGVSYSPGQYDDKSKYNLDFFGIHLQKTSKTLQMEGGYTQVLTEGAAGHQKHLAWYLEGGYKIPVEEKYLQSLMPLVRYQEIDPNNEVDDNQDQRNLSLGLKSDVSESFILRLEHNWITEKHDDAIRNNGWIFGVTFAF